MEWLSNGWRVLTRGSARVISNVYSGVRFRPVRRVLVGSWRRGEDVVATLTPFSSWIAGPVLDDCVICLLYSAAYPPGTRPCCRPLLAELR